LRPGGVAHPRPAGLIGVIVVLALLGAGCAARNVPPIGSGRVPFTLEPDERALWTRAEEEAHKLLDRAPMYHDPPLAGYLAALAERLTPDAVRGAGGPKVRILVIQDPTLNAFAMPDGLVYLHTGVLASLENEAQLAAILAHEMAHVTGRHALEAWRQARGRQRMASVLAIATSISGAVADDRGGDRVTAAMLSPTANAIIGLGLPVMTMASIGGYGADREREADADGLRSLVAAGFDPREALRVVDLLRREVGERGPIESFVLGRRTRLDERYEATRRLLRTTYAQATESPTAVRSTAEFEVRMRPVVRENAMLDIRAGRFGLARRQLDRVLAVAPDDAIGHLYYGELHRLQSQRGGTAAQDAQVRHAREHYERAASLDPGLAEAHRQLGMLYYQQKDSARARAAFETYLALKPGAADARRIEEYLRELDR
jgi:predicted Zn-dependent protease